MSSCPADLQPRVFAMPGARVSCAVCGTRWCAIRCFFSSSNASPANRHGRADSRSSSLMAPHSAIGSSFEHLVPVLAAVQDDQQLLRQLAGLRQRQDLEQLVERAEAARKDHQRLGQVGEPELPHEEVVELEVQLVGDVAVGALLERQPDVQPDRLAARLVRAAVGRLHDARPAARGDHEAVVLRLERHAPRRQLPAPARGRPRSSATTRPPCWLRLSAAL